jgi:hypothetical protein
VLLLQAVQGYRSTAESQAMTAKREAQQLKERSSVSQAAQQQLLVQLAEAEEALSSSRLTSSRLLHEGQRLEAEVSGSSDFLDVALLVTVTVKGCRPKPQTLHGACCGSWGCMPKLANSLYETTCALCGPLAFWCNGFGGGFAGCLSFPSVHASCRCTS